MATIRMLPPQNGATTVVNGRSYSCAAGSTIDVPDFDAFVLESNGWTVAAQHGVTTTGGRPVVPFKGMELLDSTLGYIIRWDGKTWRNMATGAAV